MAGLVLVIKNQSVHIVFMAYSAPHDRPRGRPREFEMDVAIERAMQAFWSNGYHATSLPELLGATKLSRGSLYAAFGDKRGLFVLSLERYIAQALDRLDQELSLDDNALVGLRACIDGYVARTRGAAGKRGCLVVATAMELAAQDREVADKIAAFFKAMRARLEAAIARAQSQKNIIDEVDPAVLAHLLTCLCEGLRVLRKVDADENSSSDAINSLIDRFVR